MSEPSTPLPHETHRMLAASPTSPSFSPTPSPPEMSPRALPSNPFDSQPRSASSSRLGAYTPGSGDTHRTSSYSSMSAAIPRPPPNRESKPARGSLLLYRLASSDDVAHSRESSYQTEDGVLMPPKFFFSPDGGHSRNSTYSIGASSTRSSIISFSSESKYPILGSPLKATGMRDSTYTTTERGLMVEYEYDPSEDERGPPDEEDRLHDPKLDMKFKSSTPWRGILNVSTLIILLLALLSLFVMYPVIDFLRNNAKRLSIDNNIRINSTGQAPDL